MNRGSQVSHLVLGVDAGGTGTRSVLATPGGRIVGRGSSAGANFRSSGGAAAARAHLATALLEALGDTDRDRVRAGVLGLAGAGAAGHGVAAELAAGAWSDAGLSGVPVVVPDLAVAFAGATDAPSGTLLLAGTGAIAARFEQRELVGRSDGHGWLLGDEGSGVWLGLQALRSVLAALDGRGEPTALTALVVTDLLGEPAGQDLEPAALCQRLLAVAYPPQPARLGALAPLVESAARAGDATASALVDEAARLLLRTLSAVESDGPSGPLVVAGSLLLRDTLVAERVARALPGRPLLPARDPAAGAAALALRAVLPVDAAAAAHRRLLEQPPGTEVRPADGVEPLRAAGARGGSAPGRRPGKG